MPMLCISGPVPVAEPLAGLSADEGLSTLARRSLRFSGSGGGGGAAAIGPYECCVMPTPEAEPLAAAAWGRGRQAEEAGLSLACGLGHPRLVAWWPACAHHQQHHRTCRPLSLHPPVALL